MEVAVLQRRISALEAELEEKEQNLVTAAQLGNNLLASNGELETLLEERSKEYSAKIESLEQAKYSVQLRLEREMANCQSLQQELDNVRQDLEEHHRIKLQRLEEVHAQKLHDVKGIQEDLKMHVKKLEAQISSQDELIRKKDELLKELSEDAGKKGNTTVLHHELKDLEDVYTRTAAEKEELESRLLELENGNKVLHDENCMLHERVASLESECEERSDMAKSWYEALQAEKERAFELNAQLEMVKMDKTISDSGNSLFGEVDDRRQEIQRKLITLQVKYDTLEKTHSSAKQQLKKLKAEMSALLCQYGATTADAAHVQRLRRALEQSRSETKILLTKVHKLEKQLAEASGNERQRCMSAFTDFGDKKEYIHFLEKELEQSRSEKATTLRELDMKSMQLLWETNKLSETEARLHQSEQEQAKAKKELTKLRLRVQETMEKLTDAQAACKLLEGEKALLEEQLKSRARKGTQLAKRRSEVAAKFETIQEADSTLNVTTTKETLFGNTTLDGQEEGMTKENKFPAPQPQPKEINLLEELERQCNSSISLRSSLLDIKEVDTSIASTSSGNPQVTKRVVHVNSNPNQCPQQ